MKYKALICCLVLLLGVAVLAEGPARKVTPGKAAALDTETWIDANRLLMFATNTGSFAHQAGNTLGKSDGLYFPFTSVDDIDDGSNDNTVIFAAGMWIGAIDATTGDTLTAISEFSDEYWPGPMLDYTNPGDSGTHDTLGDSRPEYKVYKLYADSLGDNPGGDYEDYMADAVAQGAPVDGDGEPDILGDQFLWTIYNDANADAKTNSSSQTAPIGLEIRHSTFAFDREDALGNVIFMRFRIVNKGGRDLDSVFISLWADPDLGGASDDLVGCDTILDIGYCYNATNNDEDYGSRPPCVGFDFFQGPLIFTGSDADTAQMWGNTYAQYQNMSMTSFAKYINGQEPQNYAQSYQFMEGLNGATGLPYPNGTKYYAPGNPVTKEGDLDFAPDDRRWMQTTGPISFAPGDSTEIYAAIVVGHGADRLSSITAMRFMDESAQEAFDSNFVVPPAPAAPVVTLNELNRLISLEWTNASELDPGAYTFEGYTVLQGESMNGPWTRVANYDLVNDITVINELAFDSDLGMALVKPTKFGSDNGLSYFFGTEADAINGGTLSNLTDYFFRVEAYSFIELVDTVDGLERIRVRTLTSATVLQATPQQPSAGDDISYSFADSLPTTRVAGTSGGFVRPEVISVNQLTGHTYQVTFVDTHIVLDTLFNPNPIDPDEIDTVEVAVDVAWHLDDLTTGERLLEFQTNQQGDDLYDITDGMMVKTAGPPPGFSSFTVVANADGPIDPPEAGAFEWAGFPVPLDDEGESLRPTDAQQATGDGLWGFHTADNGGTSGSGDRGSYDKFVERSIRNDNADRIGAYDWEMRFTGSYDNVGVDGGYAIEWYNDDNVFWVPFELWCIGIGTPDDVSDDYRLVPFIIDDGDDNTYNLESWGTETNGGGNWEHSVSGGDNDPFTDWVYWFTPTDNSAGEAGYLANEAEMLAGGYDASLIDGEILARTVLVSWNAGDEPPFSQDCPEMGTVFRLTTAKPNSPADTFTFVAATPTSMASGPESVLDRIRAVPNPYYLASSYDNSVYNRRLKFSNLPDDATVKIYTLGGDHVATVDRDNPDQSFEEWDVESSNGIPVASGIYLYVVESPKFGTKIGKMAVFTEEEQLGTY